MDEKIVKDSQGLAKDLVNDTISRQAAIEAIKEDKIDLTNPNVVAVFKATGDFEKVETQVMTCNRHIEILKDLPSAQPERKTGKWIYNSPVTMKCDQCGFVIKDWDWHRFKFCPNCDCDIRGEQE